MLNIMKHVGRVSSLEGTGLQSVFFLRSFLTSLSLSDTCEIRVFQIVCESCDICYYTFQRVVFGDLFAGLENEFNITGLESIGFIISITLAVTDTKLSFKHPNDTLKFNEILSPANI